MRSGWVRSNTSTRNRWTGKNSETLRRLTDHKNDGMAEPVNEITEDHPSPRSQKGFILDNCVLTFS